MANEATLLIETHLPIPFIVANATAMPKGTVCKMSDGMVAAISDGNTDIVAGIAKNEKIASDGKTRHAIYRGGIFKLKASGSITCGDAVVTASTTGSNQVMTAAVNAENILGTALDTVTTGETLRVELNPRGLNLA